MSSSTVPLDTAAHDDTLQPAITQPQYTVLSAPTGTDNRYTYFLDSEGVESFVLMKRLESFAGLDAVARCATYKGRFGHLVKGALPTSEQLAELLQQSKEHERTKRVQRDLLVRS
jgi:hypothetical protein